MSIFKTLCVWLNRRKWLWLPQEMREETRSSDLSGCSGATRRLTGQNEGGKGGGWTKRSRDILLLIVPHSETGRSWVYLDPRSRGGDVCSRVFLEDDPDQSSGCSALLLLILRTNVGSWWEERLQGCQVCVISMKTCQLLFFLYSCHRGIPLTSWGETARFSTYLLQRENQALHFLLLISVIF